MGKLFFLPFLPLCIGWWISKIPYVYTWLVYIHMMVTLVYTDSFVSSFLSFFFSLPDFLSPRNLLMKKVLATSWRRRSWQPPEEGRFLSLSLFFISFFSVFHRARFSIPISCFPFRFRARFPISISSFAYFVFSVRFSFSVWFSPFQFLSDFGFRFYWFSFYWFLFFHYVISLILPFIFHSVISVFSLFHFIFLGFPYHARFPIPISCFRFRFRFCILLLEMLLWNY